MPKVVLKENEGLDDALRRFKRQCAMSGIMSEVRKREHYDKPSVKRQVSRNGTLAEARKREFYVKPGVRRKLKSEAARKARRGK